MAGARIGARAGARLALPALIAVALGAIYLRTMAPGVTWANDGADSGDLATAAATLGVAHPSGYPTYLLLARLFQLIPVGDLAYRAALLSAASVIGAALCVYAIVRALSDAVGWRRQAGAVGAALVCGLAPLLWSQAVIAEVYALNALFAALLLWFVAAPRVGRAPVIEGLVAGLALGNHLTIGLIVVAWLLCSGWGRGIGTQPLGLADRAYPQNRHGSAGSSAGAAQRVLGLGAGLLVYAYLPLRAAAHPPISWGDPRDAAGFWWVVSGALYRPLSFGVPAGELGARVVAGARLLLGQYGLVGVALALLGLLGAPARARLFAWVSAIVAAAYLVFAGAYDTADAYLYLIPAVVIGAAWVGLGITAVLGRLPARPALAVLAAIGLAAALAGHAAATFPQVDASADRRAIDFAAHVLGVAPQGAVLVAESDLDAFPLWYDHYALGRRPDLVVLVDALLDYDWYRRNLRATYPALAIPAALPPDSSWLDALRAANPARPLCRTSAERAPSIACEP